MRLNGRGDAGARRLETDTRRQRSLAPERVSVVAARDGLQLQTADRLFYRGATQGFSVTWGMDDLDARYGDDAVGGRRTFSVRERLEAVCSNPVTRKPGCDGTRQSLVALTALVGRYLSVKAHDSSYIDGPVPGDGTYDAQHYLQTVDMVTGKPVRVTDVFPEKDVLDALFANPLIQAALATPAVRMRTRGRRPATLEELKRVLADWKSPDGRFRFTGLGEHFSFYRVDGDRVVIRMSLPPADLGWQGTMTQLACHLPIPAQLKRDFERAAIVDPSNSAKAGLLWPEVEKRFGDRKTYIRFEARP